MLNESPFLASDMSYCTRMANLEMLRVSSVAAKVQSLRRGGGYEGDVL